MRNRRGAHQPHHLPSTAGEKAENPSDPSSISQTRSLPAMAPRINFKHKREVPFEERVRESQRVREHHAERLPVIVEKAPSSDIASIDK